MLRPISSITLLHALPSEPPSKLCRQHFACRQHVAISTLPSARCHQHFACHAKVWSCTLAFSTILLLITSRNLLITGECNAACGGGGGECPRRHRACFCSGGHRRRLGRRVRGTFRPQGIWPPSKLFHQHFACRQHVAISTLPSTRYHQHFACHAHFAINTFGPQHPHTHRSLRCCGPSPASRCCMPSPLSHHPNFAVNTLLAVSTLPSTRCHQHFACHAPFSINTFGPQHPHTHRSLRCCSPSPASRCCMPSPLPSAVTTRRPFMMAVLMAAGPGMSSATLTQRTATTMRGQMAAWCVGATLRPGGGSCVTSDALVACALCHASPPSPHPSPQGAAADGGSGAPSAPKKARGSKTKLTSDEIAARKAENELRHSVAPQVSAMLSHRATPPPIPPHATPRCALNHSAAYVCLSGHLTDVAAMDLLLPGN